MKAFRIKLANLVKVKLRYPLFADFFKQVVYSMSIGHDEQLVFSDCFFISFCLDTFQIN